MSRENELVWIDGKVVPMTEARLPVEDRGFQFADGIYEVIRLYDGKPFTLRPHLDRLARSAEAISIALPLSTEALAGEITKLVARSAVRDGMVYLQVTRGVAPRNHLYPKQPKPTVLFYARSLPPPHALGAGGGIKRLALPAER